MEFLHCFSTHAEVELGTVIESWAAAVKTQARRWEIRLRDDNIYVEITNCFSLKFYQRQQCWNCLYGAFAISLSKTNQSVKSFSQRGKLRGTEESSTSLSCSFSSSSSTANSFDWAKHQQSLHVPLLKWKLIFTSSPRLVQTQHRSQYWLQ